MYIVYFTCRAGISQGAKRKNAIPTIVQFGNTDFSLCRFCLLLWELVSLMISKTNYQIHENHNCSHGNRLKASGDHESRLQMWVEDMKISRIREFPQHSVH